MSINVIGKLKPQNSGTFPVVEDIDVQGGLQIRNTLTDRDSIPALNRKAGMLVYCVADGIYYQLGSSLTNDDWVGAVFNAEGGANTAFKIDPITNTSNIGTATALQLGGDRGLTAGAVILGGLSPDTAYFIGKDGVVSVPLSTYAPSYHFIRDTLTATGTYDEMIYADSYLWALSYTGDSVATPSTPSNMLRIDPTTFQTAIINGLSSVTRTGQNAVKNSMAYESSTNTIWIIENNGFRRVSTTSASSDGVLTPLTGGESPSAITVGGGFVWIGTTTGVLYKIDPNTLTQSDSIVTLTAGDHPFMDQIFYVSSSMNGNKIVGYRTKTGLPSVMFRVDATTLSHTPSQDYYFTNTSVIFSKALVSADSLYFINSSTEADGTTAGSSIQIVDDVTGPTPTAESPYTISTPSTTYNALTNKSIIGFLGGGTASDTVVMQFGIRSDIPTKIGFINFINILNGGIYNTKYIPGKALYSDLSGSLGSGGGSSGTAGGDLSGTYPNPTVVKIQSQPISASTPGEGQIFSYQNGVWGPSDSSVGQFPIDPYSQSDLLDINVIQLAGHFDTFTASTVNVGQGTFGGDQVIYLNRQTLATFDVGNLTYTKLNLPNFGFSNSNAKFTDCIFAAGFLWAFSPDSEGSFSYTPGRVVKLDNANIITSFNNIGVYSTTKNIIVFESTSGIIFLANQGSFRAIDTATSAVLDSSATNFTLDSGEVINCGVTGGGFAWFATNRGNIFKVNPSDRTFVKSIVVNDSSFAIQEIFYDSDKIVGYASSSGTIPTFRFDAISLTLDTSDTLLPGGVSVSKANYFSGNLGFASSNGGAAGAPSVYVISNLLSTATYVSEHDVPGSALGSDSLSVRRSGGEDIPCFLTYTFRSSLPNKLGLFELVKYSYPNIGNGHTNNVLIDSIKTPTKVIFSGLPGAFGPAGGDLSGTYPNPTVSSISSITSGGDLSGNFPNPTVSKINSVNVAYPGTTGQALITSTDTDHAEWMSPAGDLSGDFSKTTVVGINNLPVDALPSTLDSSIGAISALQLAGGDGVSASASYQGGLSGAAAGFALFVGRTSFFKVDPITFSATKVFVSATMTPVGPVDEAITISEGTLLIVLSYKGSSASSPQLLYINSTNGAINNNVFGVVPMNTDANQPMVYDSTNNNLWIIGTKNAVQIFDSTGASVNSIAAPRSSSTYYISSAFGGGYVWFGTRDGLLVRYNATSYAADTYDTGSGVRIEYLQYVIDGVTGDKVFAYASDIGTGLQKIFRFDVSSASFDTGATFDLTAAVSSSVSSISFAQMIYVKPSTSSTGDLLLLSTNYKQDFTIGTSYFRLTSINTTPVLTTGINVSSVSDSYYASNKQSVVFYDGNTESLIGYYGVRSDLANKIEFSRFVNIGTTAKKQAYLPEKAVFCDTGVGESIDSFSTVGGDLSGNLPNPVVAKINQVPLSTTAPTNGDVLTYNGAAWEPRASVAGTAGGDLSGTYPNPTVAKIHGVSVSTPSGSGLLLTSTGTTSATWQTAPTSFTAGGDLSGTGTSQNVIKVNGASVPASGSLTTGNGLYVSGANALSYSALNLGGGSGFVTGTLPTANQALQTISGDASGNTGAIVVTKINGASVPLSGALTTGNVLQVSGASALTYGPINLAGGSGYITGTLPTANQANQSLLGDVTGNTGASVVAKINGISVASASGAGLVLTTTGATTAVWSTPASGFTAGGDLSGTSTSQTVIKINGTTVPAGGSLTTGNGLYVSGAGALTYSALNLAGGSAFVTGLLPTTNQASQSMSGDVTGTTASAVVSKINGATVPAAGSLTTGNGLHVSGAGTLTYSALNLAGGSAFVSGILPAANQAAQTLVGDVTGNTGASVVAKINGTSVATPSGSGLVLTSTSTSAATWQTPASGFTAGGDLSGSSTSQTVIKINGTTVPAGGSLTTGNGLYVSGSGALSYSALNLAGGSAFVSGILPTANQANQTLVGDVTGNTGASVVSKVNGITITGTPAAGNSLVATSTSAASWSSAFTAGGDLSGTATSQTVSKVQGVVISGTPANGYVLTATGSTAASWAAPAAAFTAGGDLSGTSTSQTVSKVQGVVISGTPATGYVLTATGSTAASWAAPTAGFSAGGDLTGSLTSQTVSKINGATVPVGAGLTVGNVLQVSGSTSLAYAPLNLAGGSNYVTGALPSANQVAQTLSGDATGNTGAVVVVKVNGTTVPAGGSLTTGNGLYVSGAGALSYGPLNLAGGSAYVTGTLPSANQAAQNLSGDVSGTTSASVVSKINGATVPTAGSLTTGNVLKVSGSSAVSYGSLDLSLAATVGTSVLPALNGGGQVLFPSQSTSSATPVLLATSAAISANGAADCFGSVLFYDNSSPVQTYVQVIQGLYVSNAGSVTGVYTPSAATGNGPLLNCTVTLVINSTTKKIEMYGTNTGGTTVTMVPEFTAKVG